MSKTRGSSCGGGWDSLPEELLGLILDKVLLSNNNKSVYDYVRYAAVCKSWFWCAQLQHEDRYYRRIKNKRQQQLPLLLIPPPPTDGSRTQYRSLYNISSKSSSSTLLATSVPYCKRYCGSSCGWVIFAHDHDQVVEIGLTLFNPFTGATIQLPPLLSEEHKIYEIKKVVLSDDPSSNLDNYEVLVLQSHGRLALFTRDQHGRRRWICTDNFYFYFYNFFSNFENYFDYSSNPSDIIYFNQKFHAFTGRKLGTIEIYIDDDKPTSCCYIRLIPLKGVVFEEVSPPTLDSLSYLAESINGTLVYVEIRYPTYGLLPQNVMLRIYELEEEEEDDDQGISKRRFIPLLGNEGEVIRKGGLGDQALFLGNNHSISVRASDFPGCKPNSIYFINNDKRMNEPYNAAVYTLGQDIVNPLYTGLSPPIWIEPHPNLTCKIVW